MILGILSGPILIEWWRQLDKVVLAVALLLLGMGFIVSLAASPSAAARMHLSDPFYFFWRQGGFVVLGLVILFGMSMLDVRAVRRAGAIMFVLALVLLIAVLFTGAEVKGAQRWIKLGGLSLQPVEVLKPSIIVLAAALFARPPQTQGRENQQVVASAAAASLFAVSAVLLLAQPDFGQTVLLFLVYLTLFMLAGMPLIWLGALGAVAAMGGALAYVLFPHVHNRVDSFLNPAPGEGYQIQKALQAIGQGGFLGRGPGEGAVKMSLPDAHTDFAFSVAAEEFGLVALLGLILLFAALSMRGLSMARRLRDPFAQLAASGLYCLLALEAGLNIAVNLAMVPPKGLALPFISYGGSSMIGVTLTAGLALALTRRRPGAYERPYSPRKAPVRAPA